MSPKDQTGDVLLKCEHVSKIFCSNLQKSLWYGAKDIFQTTGIITKKNGNVPLLLPEHRSLRQGEFWANKDISFELKRGECLGLIGRNGAGKTTLLKMLNGILKPDAGRITIKGKMGSLIALGAGFTPILSGRENIIANAMVLGLSKREIREQIDEIIDFADLRDFIDAPVRNYSSGMQVRLGFAIATAIQPDILVLDEVLAVGDAAFRQKCYSRLRKMMKNSAVIFVSHSMEYISQTCNKVAVLEQGTATLYDDVNSGIAQYNEQFHTTQPTEKDEEDTFRKIANPITCATISLSKKTYIHGEPFQLTVELTSAERLPDPIYVFTAINQNNQMVMAIHTGRVQQRYEITEGKQRITLSIPKLELHEGVYRWHFNLAERGKIEHLIWYNNAGSFEVKSAMRPVSDIPYVPTPDQVDIENITE